MFDDEPEFVPEFVPEFDPDDPTTYPCVYGECGCQGTDWVGCPGMNYLLSMEGGEWA